MMAEMVRLGATGDSRLRLSGVNSDYRLCSSYPSVLVFPDGVTDQQVKCGTRRTASPAAVTVHLHDDHQ